MDDIENYCFRLSSSQGVLELRASRSNYGTMLILRGVVPASRLSVATRRVIRMSPYGVRE